MRGNIGYAKISDTYQEYGCIFGVTTVKFPVSQYAALLRISQCIGKACDTRKAFFPDLSVGFKVYEAMRDNRGVCY